MISIPACHLFAAYVLFRFPFVNDVGADYLSVTEAASKIVFFYRPSLGTV